MLRNLKIQLWIIRHKFQKTVTQKVTKFGKWDLESIDDSPSTLFHMEGGGFRPSPPKGNFPS